MIRSLDNGRFSGEKSYRPLTEGIVLPKIMAIYSYADHTLDVYAFDGLKPVFLFEAPFKTEIIRQKLAEYFNIDPYSIQVTLKRIARHSTGYHINITETRTNKQMQGR